MTREYTLRPILERYFEKVICDLATHCWLWIAHTDKAGYGRLQQGSRKGVVLYAHRFAYETFIGPLPQGFEVDHLCRTRSCSNPEHLQAVLHSLNVLRGQAPNVLLHHRGTCKNGRPASTTNVYNHKSTGRIVYCRLCR